MSPYLIQTLLFIAFAGAAVVGFLSCTLLYIHTKHPNGQMRPRGLRCLYGWGMVFFIGTGLLTVNWMLAAAAPLPMRMVSADSPLGFATPLAAWMLVCIAGFCLQRAVRVIRKPEATPEGRSLELARRRFAEEGPPPRSRGRRRPLPAH